MCYPYKGSLWPYVNSIKTYLCPVDQGAPATAIAANANVQRNYPLSYSVNFLLNHVKLDSMHTKAGQSKCLLLIHESRNTINDGKFRWGYGDDTPSNIHYDGTTVGYCDGHAAFKSKTELNTEMTAGYWVVPWTPGWTIPVAPTN